METKFEWTIPAVLALIALAQPWLIILVKKLIKPKATLDVRMLELCYSSFGHTLSVLGVVHCNAGNVFVKEIVAKVKRERNESTREFRWLANKSLKIAPDLSDYSIATGCVVTADSPVPLHAFLTSRVEWGDKFDALRARNAEKYSEAKENAVDSADEASVNHALRELMIAEPSAHEAYSMVTRAFFWEASRYTAHLTLLLADGRQLNAAEIKFEVSEAESKRLCDGNSFQILEEAVGRPVDFYFCYPEIHSR